MEGYKRPRVLSYVHRARAGEALIRKFWFTVGGDLTWENVATVNDFSRFDNTVDWYVGSVKFNYNRKGFVVSWPVNPAVMTVAVGALEHKSYESLVQLLTEYLGKIRKGGGTGWTRMIKVGTRWGITYDVVEVKRVVSRTLIRRVDSAGVPGVKLAKHALQSGDFLIPHTPSLLERFEVAATKWDENLEKDRSGCLRPETVAALAGAMADLAKILKQSTKLKSWPTWEEDPREAQ